MPTPITQTLRRRVYASDGRAFNVEISPAGILIREPRQSAFLVPWGRLFLLGAQIAAEHKPKRVTRGLMTTR